MSDGVPPGPGPHPAPGSNRAPDAARQGAAGATSTAVLDVRGIQWASQQNRLTATLSRRPGVLDVASNPVAQTATVRYDPDTTSLVDLQAWVRDCGFHCAGQSVPAHICAPMTSPRLDHPGTDPAGHRHTAGSPVTSLHLEHDVPPASHAHLGSDADRAPDGPALARAGGSEQGRSPHETMGHGGHAGASMATMVTDMRNRFLVAMLFSIPIVLWSPIGTDVLGLNVPVPFGLRQDVWALALSLPVVFYASSIFFDGAVRALRARTLDMMVLVAVAVGSGWLTH